MSNLMLRKGDHVKYKGCWYYVSKTLNIPLVSVPRLCIIDREFRK